MPTTTRRLSWVPSDAVAYRNRGLAWNFKKEYDRAVDDCNQAIKLDPDDAVAYRNRGLAWYHKKEYDRAIADCDQAIKLDPNNASAYNDRGFAWNSKKEYDRAIADYNQAIKLDPNYIFACNNLAWLQATCPNARFRDGRKAVENASRAYELSGGLSAAAIDTLAVAYAESGNFQKAKEWQAKVIEMATNQTEKERCRSRLRLYQQGKPYHQEP